MTFLLSLADLRAAAEAERDATPGSGVVSVGPAEADNAWPTAVSQRFVVRTGPLRCGDLLDHQLRLLDEQTNRLVRPNRLVVWPGDRLHLEATVGGQGSANKPANWVMVAEESGRRAQRTAEAAFLHAVPEGGVAQLLLRGALQTGPSDGLAVLSGSADGRWEVLSSAVASMWQLGRRTLIVSADPVALDELARRVHDRLGQPDAGVVVRVGVPASETVASDPRVTLDGAIDRLAPEELAELAELASRARHRVAPTSSTKLGRPEAPTQRDVATARAILAEAVAMRTAAESATTLAANTHSDARQRLRHMETERARHRQVDDLAGETRQATAETVASAAGVGRLADQIRRSSVPAEREQLARQLLVAAEVAAARLLRRDAIVDQLHRIVEGARSSGVSRSKVEHAERALQVARAAHAGAEAALARARATEDEARSRLKQIADARLLNVVPVPSVSDEGEADLAARHGEVSERRARKRGAALDNAVVLLATPGDLVSMAELAGQRVDHVFVEQASALPLPTVYVAASRARRAVTLAVDPAQQPPPPACPDPDHHRYLGRSVVDLLGLRGPDGALAAHPHVLVVD